MKVLIVGSFSHWNALEKHYFYYLTSLGAEVSIYPFPDNITNFRNQNILNKIRYRYNIFIRSEISKLNLNLISYIKSNKYDIVWIFKGNDILPATLLSISRLGCKLVNYNPDHPFIRTFRSGGGEEIEKCVPLYDLYFSYSRQLLNDIDVKYNKSLKTAYLPFGFELKDDSYSDIQKMSYSEGWEISKICFIGNPDTELRYKTLERIIENNLPIDIYGQGWSKYLRNTKKAKIFDGVYGLKYWETLRRYKIQLNIFRPHNYNSHNMRSFEIPAVGGIQLAPYSVEHSDFFVSDQEIFLYDSYETLLDKANNILSFSNLEIQDIRAHSRIRSINSGYSYEQRANFVYDNFIKLLS